LAWKTFSWQNFIGIIGGTDEFDRCLKIDVTIRTMTIVISI
ncbi:23316_t:CDS:1, partial [Gigaspora rosea]